jgi:predicted Na+-dependent transporter
MMSPSQVLFSTLETSTLHLVSLLLIPLQFTLVVKKDLGLIHLVDNNHMLIMLVLVLIPLQVGQEMVEQSVQRLDTML